MSEYIENDDLKSVELALITNKSNNDNIAVNKSESFDAEFDLLTSTLSELKDNEIDNTGSTHSYVNQISKDHSDVTKLDPTNNNTDTTNTTKGPGIVAMASLTSKTKESINLFENLCDNGCERPCKHKHNLSTPPLSKSMYHKEVSVTCQNSSENVLFQDCNSSELKTEVIKDICAIGIEENKLVLVTKCNLFSNTSDKTNCDEQPSLSLRNLEVPESHEEPEHCIGSSAEELSQTNKSFDDDCNLNHVTNELPIYFANNKQEKSNVESFTNLHETEMSNIGNFEQLPKTTIMGDDEVTCENIPCQPLLLNNIVIAEEIPETNVRKEIYFEDPDSEIQFVNNENKNQENTLDSKTGKCFDTKLESYTTPKKPNFETEVSEFQKNEVLVSEPIMNQGIYYSTPNVSKTKEEHNNNVLSEDPYFGDATPLKGLQGKHNLKRKHFKLEPIDEIDEDTDSISEKKMKIVETHSVIDSDACTSKLHCFEAPAKSLLKMWQPSCLSRNASGFIVLDECGESEDECTKVSQENSSKVDSSNFDNIDDFEIAYQSLTEELMKSSSHIETLEKYHSQVQLENQIDDEKFDEIWRELTMNVDLDDKTCLSIKSMDESTLTELNQTCLALQPMDESVNASSIATEEKNKDDKEGFSSENNRTIVEGYPLADNGNEGICVGVNNEIQDEQEQTNDNKDSENIFTKGHESADDGNDEEEVLLEGNDEKDYEFFEYVSTDPKENEDNYNPEWQKLGSLTTDEERYKAVRDRWRSLVPPDPNRNLTYRQWRARNSLSPIEFVQSNKVYNMRDDKTKKQLCTAVFEEKINSIVKELEISRMNIFRKRNREFELLGQAQDEEQIRAQMRGISRQDQLRLHNYHLNQCRSIKTQYDLELKQIQEITERKIRILREASEEVLLFQKFYKGVGAQDDTEMYMTDHQVQELMETEEMLEKYKEMYK